MSRLRSLFNDINEREYIVEFNVDDGSSSLAGFQLCDNPFTTEMDESNGNLYNPVKCQGATVRLLTSSLNDYKMQLYSPQAQKIKVTLQSNELTTKTEWVGYVEPSLYDIGYNYVNEELEVNCIDGLSSLQYFRYKSINTDKGIYTYKQLLKHILNKCECYKFMYLPLSQFINRTDELNNTPIYDRIKVSEQVFFDKDGKNEKDLTYKQALEALMQYLGLTCVAYGQDVYVIDYDAVKQGNGSFLKVDISGNTSDSVVSLISGHTITADDYSEGNSHLSLDKIYQKASVEDEFYTVDSLMPDLYEKEKLQKIFPVNLNIPKHAPVTEDKWCYYSIYRNTDHEFYCYDNSGNTKSLDDAVTICHPLRNVLDYDTIYHNDKLISINIIEGNYPSVIPPDIMRLSGQCAVIAEYHNYDGNKYKIEYLQRGYIVQPYFEYDHALVLCVNQKSTLDTFPSPVPVPTVKLATLKPALNKPLDSAGDIFLVIEGEFYYQNEYGLFGYNDEGSKGYDDKWNDDDAYITCSLYYNGKWLSQYEAGGQIGERWVNQETTFKLYLWRDDHKHYLNQPMKVRNNIPYNWGINKEGYAVRLPNSTISDDMRFTIYTPHSIHQNLTVGSVWAKNFNFSLHCKGEDEQSVPNNTTKTLYYNVDNEIFSDIDENNVDEFSTIKFKLTTYDGKKVAYSCPTYVDNGTSKYVNQILSTNTDELLRPEEHMIGRIVRQYSDKTTILQLALDEQLPPYTLYTDDNLNKEFIVDSSGYNYRYRTNNLKLIEKK